MSAYIVALLAEGVDRNSKLIPNACRMDKSPSSRRAWIEIFSGASPFSSASVALLAEGVDRNVVPSGITLEQWEAVCEAVQEERNSIMTARRYDFGSYEENIQHVIIDETCRRLGVKCYRREARK